ncbi:uncharacterized protein F5147DRAFT_588378 [Suillus discolor]|uniref:Uncharacterized protein n=1 Tax=Suillus discolor TaxID=1912936 RepID=A0A9P7ERI8_9AGAM|nr:uncharacterized protein F5147DRAFT_588378 [Suillus discolor]KAG2086887.1 hypothetical protein F5147DRAFT_588378 [Suillus discolor]
MEEVLICVPTTPNARAKRRIAALMDEIEILKQDKAMKQRKTTYYVSQGRAIRRMVVLYTPIEDLITENDRCCEDRNTGDCAVPSAEQDRLQRGYVELTKVLPWIHEKLASLDNEESEDMLKKLKQGTDSACGDDTGTLKELMALWVNIERRPTSLLRADDKHHRGFMSNACSKLLCPAEWHWDDPIVKAGIRDRTVTFIVSGNLWPSYMYEDYEADSKNLERGLMKSKLLLIPLQAFKAIFTSPSSANEVDGEVKTCVASIIGMRKVTPRAIAYTACQVRFALSNITSWRIMDGDFDYQIFWNNRVDFFEDTLGPAARARVNELLEWWTRQVTDHQ